LVGITDYTSYVPRYRLRHDLIAEQWGAKSLGGTKAVANFDEDALTEGFAAAWTLIQRDNSNDSVDALYFASTTSPYWQRAASSFIVAACDLREEIETLDFGGSLRAGIGAVRAACNAVSAGACNKVVITAADVREAAPESAEEQILGDAAAAVMVGKERVLAELIGQVVRSDDFFDEWRRDRDRYLTALTSRYTTERGYLANVIAAGQQALKIAGLKPENIAFVALSSPDGRAHKSAAQKIGFVPEQLIEVAVKDEGITGTPLPLTLLCKALDRAKPGAVILVIGHGDGADALLFRVTDQKQKQATQISDSLTLEIPSYGIYRKLRDFTRVATEEGAVISNVMFEKEEKQNVRLHATRCSHCETVQFPPTVVCVKCRGRDDLQEVRLRRRGTIFTFTKDYLYSAPNPPTVMAVVELEEGARFYCQVTDVDPDKVKIGQNVELTLRRLKDGGGMHHYYWKCRPV
jgi:hydroxymethylglutaryl-CoA synthase